MRGVAVVGGVATIGRPRSSDRGLELSSTRDIARTLNLRALTPLVARPHKHTLRYLRLVR
jgi:hypothetical protein